MRPKKDIMFLLPLALGLSISATLFGLVNNTLITYGDAESHLNIAKRVTDSVTPGLAQLGGIWLPLPHLLMVPFTSVNWLWQTGMAGAIISGLSYVLAAYYLYSLIFEITADRNASRIGSLVFMLNPNILYLQTTAMTEIPLIAFFNGSIYYFVKHINTRRLKDLVLSAGIGLAATLSRYDGWFLVLFQAGILMVWYLFQPNSRKQFIDRLKVNWHRMEANIIIFASMAFVGIFLWMLWDYLILNDPLYFTNSPFSAKSQQQDWLARGELPAYNNLPLSFWYYMITSYVNIGSVISLIALVGFIGMMAYRPTMVSVTTTVLLLIPVIFYTLTLYMGQSIIFIPQLTPSTYEWNLFNVRYGVMMIPAAAVAVAYLLYIIKQLSNRKVTLVASSVLCIALMWQQLRYVQATEPVISYEDGVTGLSASKSTDAEEWIKNSYDGGYILVDDFARTLSIIRSGLPMDKVIYVGNKPYWEESFENPEKYARWIVMQDGDSIWNGLYENEAMLGRVYTHFEKAYTSPQILIFKRVDSS